MFFSGIELSFPNSHPFLGALKSRARAWRAWQESAEASAPAVSAPTAESDDEDLIQWNFCWWHPIHPGRLTWTIMMEVWKIIFLSKWVVYMFHVNLPGCTGTWFWARIRFSGKKQKSPESIYEDIDTPAGMVWGTHVVLGPAKTKAYRGLRGRLFGVNFWSWKGNKDRGPHRCFWK